MSNFSKMCSVQTPPIIRHEHSHITFSIWNSYTNGLLQGQDSQNGLLGSTTTKVLVGH